MLTLLIKKKWFDMIARGEKLEEYRDITPYYIGRFQKALGGDLAKACDDVRFRVVRFRNGYRADSPLLEAVVSFRIGTGRPKWGAEPGRKYIVLRIWEVKRIS